MKSIEAECCTSFATFWTPGPCADCFPVHTPIRNPYGIGAIFQRVSNTIGPSLSFVELCGRRDQEHGSTLDEELDKVEAALDQLERAELYIVASIELDFSDPYRHRLLSGLRAQVAATRRSLARPRVVDQAFSR